MPKAANPTPRYRYPYIEKALKDCRDERKVNIGELAKELGIGRASLYYKLSGEIAWTINDLVNIQRLTGISYEQLVAHRYVITDPRKPRKSAGSADGESVPEEDEEDIEATAAMDELLDDSQAAD